MLRFINWTFGRATEVLDLLQAVQDNTYMPEGTILVDKNGNERVLLDATPLSDVSLDMQRQFIEMVAEGEIPIEDVWIDEEAIVNQWSVNNSMDRAIGITMGKYAEAIGDIGHITGIRSNPFY